MEFTKLYKPTQLPELEITPYVRPSDWLQIPAMDDTKDDIYILNGVQKNGISCIVIKLNGVGTINWGDGNTETFNISELTAFTHRYDFDSLPSSSWSEYSNAKQVIVHIYGNRNAITRIDFSDKYTFLDEDGTEQYYSGDVISNIYEIYGNTNSAIVNVASTTSGAAKLGKLETFDWSGQFYTSSETLSLGSKFKDCYSLQNLPRIKSNKPIKIGTNIFENCYKLQVIPKMDLENGSGLNLQSFKNCFMLKEINTDIILESGSHTFENCYSLRKLKQESISVSTSIMSNTFSNCKSLTTIPEIILSKKGNLMGIFAGCSNLIKPVKISGDISSIKEMYLDCVNLTGDIDMQTKEATTMEGAFQNCGQINNVRYLNTKKCKTFTNAFNGCYSLERIIPLDCSVATEMTDMFNVRVLKGVILYNAGAGTTNALTIGKFTNAKCFTRQAVLDLFNSLKPNDEGYERTLVLGATLMTNLMSYYVKDSDESVTVKLPTVDTAIVPGKTYYTYDFDTDTYTEVTPDFSTDTRYFELVTASWHRYDFCEASDADGMIMTDYVANVLKWTVTA